MKAHAPRCLSTRSCGLARAALLAGSLLCALTATETRAQQAAASPSEPDGLRTALSREGRATIYGIVFELGKDRLRLPASEPLLQQILKLLQDDPALKLEVRVHSDDSFRNIYGHRPTQRRADEIVRWLIVHGVAPARLVAKGYGETQPVAPNRTPEDRARNRRVELVKLP